VKSEQAVRIVLEFGWLEPQAMSKMSFESELWFRHSLNGSDEKVCRGSITVRRLYKITFGCPIDRFVYSQYTVVTSNGHK
jgi:hypothetical protein